MRRVSERRALRPALRARRGVVRREHVLAHELECDDLARLEDDVLLRRRRGRAREAELGREARDEVVRVLRAPHVDLHDGEVVCIVERRVAEVLGAQAVAEVEQAAVLREGLSLDVQGNSWMKVPGPIWRSTRRWFFLNGPLNDLGYLAVQCWMPVVSVELAFMN